MRTALAAALLLAGLAPVARAADAPAAATPTAGKAATPSAPAAPTGTAAAERLLPLLRSDDPAVREKAAAALAKIGAPALGPLEAELAHEDARAARVRALIVAIQPSAEPARPGERWYETSFREAARRVERGDHLGAVKLLDALLVIDPELPIRDRILALRIRAKELEVRASVIEARLVPKRVLLAPGEPIEVEIQVKNVSTAPLELALPDAPKGDIFGAIEVETLEATPGGERTRRRELQKIDKAIQGRLAPGEIWRTTLTIHDDRAAALDAETGRPLPARPELYRRITLSGSIRSQVLIRRDEKFDRFLPLFPIEIHVVDRAWHALAADARGAIAESIETLRRTHDEAEARRASERLFFAALLAPASAREQAIDALGATLANDRDPAAPAAMGALSVLADQPFDLDRLAWIAWLKRRAN
jgi:hypothetical protein